MKNHSYELLIEWKGNRGTGTSGYREYGREHLISAGGKNPIEASSDPSFNGDLARYNPEEMLVASLSSCHMLWFLHLCADSGIIITSYSDKPIGIMDEGNKESPGRFIKVTLRPQIEMTGKAGLQQIISLHESAHKLCFIANSVNFPVVIEPRTS